jgi:hypothetical protein
MRLPKTIPGVAIMLLVLLPCLYCIYFQAKSYMIWRQMEEKLESEQLQTLIIPVKSFRWYEEGREIVFEGMMFDVKSITRQGDKYVVTGLFDHLETKLNLAMGRIQREQGNSPDAQIISKLLSQTIIGPAGSVNLYAPATGKDDFHWSAHSEELYNTILSIHTPPPRS